MLSPTQSIENVYCYMLFYVNIMVKDFFTAIIVNRSKFLTFADDLLSNANIDNITRQKSVSLHSYTT